MLILRFTFFLHLLYRSSSRKVKPWVLFSMAVAFAVRIFSILKCIHNWFSWIKSDNIFTGMAYSAMWKVDRISNSRHNNLPLGSVSLASFFHIFFNFGVFFVPKNYLNPRYFSYSNEYECMLTLSSILYLAFVKRGCAKFLKVEKLSETFSNTLILDWQHIHSLQAVRNLGFSCYFPGDALH